MVELKIEKFKKDKHFYILDSWWKKYGGYCPPIKFLPTNGYVIVSNTDFCCAGFLYRTDSKICVFEWVVSNPGISKDLRSQSIDYLIKYIKKEARRLGFSMIYCSVGIKKYIERLKKYDFCLVDTGQNHLFCEV